MKTRMMLMRAALCCIAATCALGIALADQTASPDEPQGKVVAQAAPQPPPQAAPAKAPELTERVSALEREDVVLREDLGKTRLDARTSLDEAARRQAEINAKLQQRVDELNARLEAEHERQARRNRHLWLALGIIALAALAGD